MTLINHGSDTVVYNETLLNLNKTGEIRFNETDFTLFMIVKNVEHHQGALNDRGDPLNPIFLEEGIEKYV